MSKIKTRETVKDIKVLDKAAVAGKRMKNAFIRSKDTAQSLTDDGQASPGEYAGSRVQDAAGDISHDAAHLAGKGTKSAVNQGKEAFQRRRAAKKAEQTSPDTQRVVEQGRELTQKQAKSQADSTGSIKQKPEQHIKTAEQVNAAGKAPEGVRRTEQVTEKSVTQPTARPGKKSSVQTVSHSPHSERPASQPPRREQEAVRPIKTMERGKRTIRQSATSARKGAGRAAKTTQDAVKTAGKGTIKTTQKTIKTAQQTSKTAIKTAQTTAKAAQKTA